jgi:hypothetical protein
LCFTGINFAQNNYVQPHIGWDSLQQTIEFPELAKRIGYNTALTSIFRIDSTGKIFDIVTEPLSQWIEINKVRYENQLNPIDSLFAKAVEKSCWDLTWNVEFAQKTELRIHFIFISHLSNSESKAKVILREVIHPAR